MDENLIQFFIQQKNEIRNIIKIKEPQLNLLNKLISYIEKEWYFHIIDLISESSSIIKSMENESKEKINEIYNEATEKSKNIYDQFPKLIQDKFSNNSPKVDLTSRHPKYSFEDGFFQLVLDDNLKKAKISDYESILHDIPADIGAIEELLKREYQRIFERSFKGEVFLKKLLNNYIAVIKKKGMVFGDLIPIRSITQRLGKNQKKFRTDEFLIDLSKLVREGPYETDNKVFDLQQTKDTNQGMLLYNVQGKGYISLINFKKK